MNRPLQLTVGGVRGSVSAPEAEFRRFGGATSSLRLRFGDEALYLDAGTGLLPLPEGVRRASVLIGHPHLDHLSGLGTWSALTDSANEIDIYLRPRDGVGCEALLDRVYSPPVWPLRLRDYPATVRFHDLNGDFSVGDLKISPAEGHHPGGVTHFRISDGFRSLVYAVDADASPEEAALLTAFARNCDLLICDAHYPGEIPKGQEGWGHGSALRCAEIGKAAGAKRTLCTHFAPTADDELLSEAERAMLLRYPACRFARQGEIINL